MSLDWDKYVVGFVAGLTIGVAVTSPTKEAPEALEKQIKREIKRYEESAPPLVIPVSPVQEAVQNDVMIVRQVYSTKQNYRT